jgi:hypothetical protein
MQQCAFCPSVADLTGEHLWSDWMNKVIPGRAGFMFSRHTAEGRALHRWKKRHLDIKLKVVCGTCNNNWMSRLEDDHAKPAIAKLIVDNGGVLLSPGQIRSIVLFAFKSLAARGASSGFPTSRAT